MSLAIARNSAIASSSFAPGPYSVPSVPYVSSLAERAAVFGVLRIELLRLAQRGECAVDVEALAKKAAEEVVLEDAGQRELRVRVRPVRARRRGGSLARRVAEAADQQRAGDLDVVLRLFRMQRGQLAELAQRAGDVAGIELGLADRDRSR